MRELAGLLAQIIGQNRQAQGGYPVVFQDSTAIPVCKVARAKQHKTFAKLAHKSKTGSGWYYGFKLHAQCDQEGRLCGFCLTAANTDDRKLLEPLTQWMDKGIVVADKGYLSQQAAYDLGARKVQLITGTRKNMKKLATPFQLACLQARHRIEEVFEFLKCCFGLIRSTHRADYALPLHFMVCLLAYSLYKLLIA